MQVNKKILSVIGIIFSVITLILSVLLIFEYVNINFCMVFLGFTQVANGLSQINFAKQTAKNGKNKGNRTIGIISIVIGIGIITMYCIKLLL